MQNGAAKNLPEQDAASVATTPGGRGVPRNFMVPWVLLLLKQWSAHGYWIMQNLQNMGFATVDHATLYRELRSMEKQGLVTSAWQTDGNGPAKRTYTITQAGEEFLKAWADTVAGYQRMITGFFDLYGKVVGFSPLDPGPASAREATTQRESGRKKEGGSDE